MKILLLTDIPPTNEFTAGIFLDNMLNYLPKDSVVCFNVLNKELHPHLSESAEHMPIQVTAKPRENWGTHPAGKYLSTAMEYFISMFEIPQIVDKIVEFGMRYKVDRVWVTLQGQTMIRLALPVAKKLGVPLYSQVYDPPNWWMRANRVSPGVAGDTLNLFGETLSKSKKCALASWAMVEYYGQLYGAKGVPMVSCVDPDYVKEPAKGYLSEDEFVICMAGQLYASEEWLAFLRALDSINWALNGKKIKVKYLGEWLAVGTKKPWNLEYLGWRSAQEVINIASKSDLCYCPYWFDPTFDLETRLSFPSKLPLYFASGRPVFFHGPVYSSPGRFTEQHQSSHICDSLDPIAISDSLIEIATNLNGYNQIASNAHQTLLSTLTHIQMKQRVVDFLEL